MAQQQIAFYEVSRVSDIVLVEEEKDLLSRLAGTLRNAQFIVHERSCIVELLTSCAIERPDLIVVRGPFSGLDVPDLLELRRELPPIATVPVLVIAANAQSKLNCFRLGCDDFVVQPVEETELFFRICSLLRRQGEAPPADEGIRGSLSDIGIVDLVQMFVASRKDGTPHVDRLSGSGCLYFSDGHVSDAEWGEQVGEPGFVALLTAGVGGGGFCFIPESTSAREVRIDKRTDHLLLGFANMMDEGKV